MRDFMVNLRVTSARATRRSLDRYLAMEALHFAALQSAVPVPGNVADTAAVR